MFGSRAFYLPPSSTEKNPFYEYAAAAGKKIAELCELSFADLVPSEKNSPFLKGSGPRVSKRDSTIPLRVVSCGVEERRTEGERESEVAREVEK